MRSDNVIKTKAKNKVKKILELESSDTDTDSTYSSSNISSSDSPSSSSSSDYSVKKIRKNIYQSLSENLVFMTNLLMRWLKNSMSMQGQK